MPGRIFRNEKGKFCGKNILDTERVSCALFFVFLVENTQEHGMELNTFKTFYPQRDNIILKCKVLMVVLSFVMLPTEYDLTPLGNVFTNRKKCKCTQWETVGPFYASR